MNDKLKRYFQTVERINQGLDVSDDDLSFIFEYSPEINEQAIADFVKGNKDRTATPEQIRAGVIEVGRKLQSDPIFKERIVKLATETKGKEKADRLTAGLGLVLAGTDIVNSINQINESKKEGRKSKRPSRPVVPQRDALLQQALRQSQESTFDQENAIAPVRAEIQNQYQNDIANAKTASTGQAGAFGSYAQLAADRRNQASMQLAPIKDSIRSREQQRYDNLLGMRQAETQNMFQNQASLYPYDLHQYNQDQQAIAALGSTGRQNLSTSLQNTADQIPRLYQNLYGQRYNKIKNSALASGLDGETANLMAKGRELVDGHVNPQYTRYNLGNLYSE